MDGAERGYIIGPKGYWKERRLGGSTESRDEAHVYTRAEYAQHASKFKECRFEPLDPKPSMRAKVGMSDHGALEDFFGASRPWQEKALQQLDKALFHSLNYGRSSSRFLKAYTSPPPSVGGGGGGAFSPVVAIDYETHPYDGLHGVLALHDELQISRDRRLLLLCP